MSIAQRSVLNQHPSDSRPSNATKYVLMIILQRPYPSHFDRFLRLANAMSFPMRSPAPLESTASVRMRSTSGPRQTRTTFPSRVHFQPTSCGVVNQSSCEYYEYVPMIGASRPTVQDVGHLNSGRARGRLTAGRQEFSRSVLGHLTVVVTCTRCSASPPALFRIPAHCNQICCASC